jgi:hypothetical protein
MMTNLNSIIGKDLSMEVSESVVLNIRVLNENEIQCQFVDTDDGTKDPAYVTKLETAYDDIDDVEDYSFLDGFGLQRFFLFQFS